MNRNENDSTLHKCSCCLQELPADKFYMKKRGSLDVYCKECRNARNRLYRKSKKLADSTRATTATTQQTAARCYLVITDLPPGDQRHRLLHHALQVVHASMEARSHRLRNDTDNSDSAEPTDPTDSPNT